MTKTENECYRGILALTKPSRAIVYTFISDIDIQTTLEQTADSGSAAQTYSDLQKEAETFLSSIALNLPERGIGRIGAYWPSASLVVILSTRSFQI